MLLQPPVIFLFGPTATGKTQTALHLAQCLPCDIISVDAIQVYKGLDIGSAKPTKNILSQYPHHLIDIREPTDVYSVADFYRDAQQLIIQSLKAKRIPLLVGGSMMYFALLEQGVACLPATDNSLRAEIQAKANLYGWTYWHSYLQKHDPVTAATLSPQDSQRLERALQVWMQTGKSISQLQQVSRQPGIGSILAAAMPGTMLIKIGLTVENKASHNARLEARFQSMLESGFIEEVANLYHRQGLNLSFSAINSVGYRQIWQYLQGSLSYTEMLSSALIANRRLVKHQMTWLRSWHDVRLFPCETDKLCAAIYDDIINYCDTTRLNRKPNFT